jgi:microcystin-dependent protein
VGNLSALANNVVQTTPVGVIEAFAGVNAPAGWLFCDGSAVSRVQYPELFSALSTTYGTGDGSTTFNLPDLRGRMPFGKGTHADVASLGQNEGASLANRRPKHQHTVYDPTHSHDIQRTNVAASGQGTDTSSVYRLQAGTGASYSTSQGNSSGVRVNPENAASSSSPSDAPPYLVVNYIIKAVADLPRGGWFYQNQPPVVTQLPSNPQIGEEVYHLVSGNLFQKRYDGTQWKDVGQETLNTARLSGTVSNTNLPDGAPSWLAFGRVAFPTGVSQAANIGFSVPYKSQVLIQASVSGYGGPGLARQYLAVYGVTGWTEGSFYYFNFANDHRTLPTGGLQLTLNAGSYTVGTYILNINTDANDQASYFFFGRKVT